VYGTQIFWPLVTTPMTWSSIFIIDPLYTVPLLIGVVAALIAARDRRWGHTANTVGIVISSAYLVWTLAAKLQVEQIASNALQQQGLDHVRLLTTPAPFNTLLWRVLAVDDRHYYEGYYSVFDDDHNIRFERYPRGLDLIEPIAESWAVQRLRWFSKEFFAAGRLGNDIIITDLRMGAEPEYIFRFRVGRLSNPHAQPAPVVQLPGIRNFERLHWIWARIWDQQAREHGKKATVSIPPTVIRQQ
jgi:inner membrane protein